MGVVFPEPGGARYRALDLERLHPGDEFYSSGDVQAALLDVLTVWSLENPSIGYRQGMHELAALIFSQRAADAAGLGHEVGLRRRVPARPTRSSTARPSRAPRTSSTTPMPCSPR